MADARLATILTEVVEGHGLELDQVEVIPAGRRSVVRVIVDGDGPKGRGPSMDQIAQATRDISDTLDASDPVAGSYTLEVSSRGVSTPLTELKHYRRNLTRLVKVNLADGGQLVGRIIEVGDDQVVLEVTPESVKGNRNPRPERHGLNLDQITKAIVQIELNRPAGLDDEDELADLDEDELDEDELDDDDVDEDESDDVDSADQADQADEQEL